MKKSPSEKTLVVIAGPTASGKTRTAVSLGLALNAPVVSADARQFYRELSIGAAIPSIEEMKGVSHFLIGHLSVSDQYNVSMYERDALEILDSLFAKHPIVLLAGGSGLYLDTLCFGMDDIPAADPGVRSHVKSLYELHGLEGLRRQLRIADPAYASEVDPANPKRMMRGLEVFLTTGIPYSEMRKRERHSRPFRVKQLVLERPREELFGRINKRTDEMIQRGLIEEALSVYRYRDMNSLNTVGYKELFLWLSGHWSLHQAIEKIKTNTRRYAKRQITWFRRYEHAFRVHPENEDLILDYILRD